VNQKGEAKGKGLDGWREGREKGKGLVVRGREERGGKGGKEREYNDI